MSDFENLSGYAEIADSLIDPGLIYHPSPQVLPDTRQGFDADGNWHVNSQPVPSVDGQDDYYTRACEVARIAGRERMAHQVIQSIIGEIDYVGTGRDDEVYARLGEIAEQNGLPYDSTPDELYALYRSNYGGTS